MRKYDFKTGQTETVFTTKTISMLSIGYGYLYYSLDGKEHVLRNLTTGREFRVSKDGFQAMFSEGLLFIDDSKIEFWRYGTEVPEETGRITDIPDNRRLNIECITDKWVYAFLFSDEDAIRVYCPKDDFMKGKPEWREYDIE